MGQVFDMFNLVWVISGFSGDGIAPVTRRAAQAKSILAILELFKSFGRAVFVHRFDFAVARDAPFEFWSGSGGGGLTAWGCRLRLSCSGIRAPIDSVDRGGFRT